MFIIKKTLISFFALFALFSFSLSALADKKKKANEIVNVHGKATFTLNDDKMSIKEAQHECIKLARLNAIKDAFGEQISTNTNMIDANIDGQEFSSFREEINISTQADWIEDTKDPKIDTEVDGDKIIFKAEVWGKARKLPTAMIDLDWQIMTGQPGNLYETNSFQHKQRIYIKFKAPVDGFLAVYLLDSTNKEANCLLPYKNNPRGRHEVKGGQEYILFDKENDPKAINYNLTTSAKQETNNVVLIFSPNSFTKCNEITGDRRHPNSLSVEDFNAWLNKQRRYDSDMVVDNHKWVTITNKNAQ